MLEERIAEERAAEERIIEDRSLVLERVIEVNII